MTTLTRGDVSDLTLKIDIDLAFAGYPGRGGLARA